MAADHAQQERYVRKLVGKFQCNTKALADGTALELLRLAAQIRFGTDIHGASCVPGFERVIELLGPDVAHAVEAGWIRAAQTIALNAEQLGEVEAALQEYSVEAAVVAGIDRLLSTEADAAGRLSLSAALVVLRMAPILAHKDRAAENRLEDWALDFLAKGEPAGTATLSAFWHAALKHHTKSALSGSWALQRAAEEERAGFATDAVRETLRHHPNMAGNVLIPLLHVAARVLSPEELLALAQAAILAESVLADSRELWLIVAFVLNPNAYRQSFVEMFAGRGDQLSGDASLMERVADGLHTQRILITLGVLEAATRTPSGDHDGFRTSILVRSHLESLQNSNDPLARIALLNLVEDTTMPEFRRREVRHALAEQARRLLDSSFQPLTPAAIMQVLLAGPPANAADLFAVTVEQLRNIQAEMQTGALNSWESYWNETPRTPKTENRCRDILARELQARLRPFGIDIPVLPEAQRAAETRADLLMISNQGKNLPLEAKRHWHPDVWTAAGTQLQGYAADVDAEHFGIYVVFWFGAIKPAPARQDRRRPASASDMEQMLENSLREAMKSRTAIVVLDVADPRAKKRASAVAARRRVRKA